MRFNAGFDTLSSYQIFILLSGKINLVEEVRKDTNRWGMLYEWGELL